MKSDVMENGEGHRVILAYQGAWAFVSPSMSVKDLVNKCCLALVLPPRLEAQRAYDAYNQQRCPSTY